MSKKTSLQNDAAYKEASKKLQGLKKELVKLEKHAATNTQEGEGERQGINDVRAQMAEIEQDLRLYDRENMSERKKKELMSQIHSLGLKHFRGSFTELNKWLQTKHAMFNTDKTCHV